MTVNARTKRFNRFLTGHSGGKKRSLGMTRCGHCDKEIYSQWESGRPRKFCDRTCWKAAFGQTDPKARRQAEFLARAYGLTPLGFEQILADQGGGCAICKRATHGTGCKRLHVDHDHKTGKVRGVLCASCNRALGYFQDNPDRLRIAADYLQKQSY